MVEYRQTAARSVWGPTTQQTPAPTENSPDRSACCQYSASVGLRHLARWRCFRLWPLPQPPERSEVTRRPIEGTTEALVAEYLDKRDLQWEYEKAINGRRPDFYIDYPDQPFVIEVYDPIISLPAGGGWLTSYPALRKAFEGAKQKQIAAVKKAGIPYVGALGKANADMDINPQIMAGAMFGDLTITFPVGSLEPIENLPSQNEFGGNAKLQPEQFRAVSTIVLPRLFNPTLWRVEEAWDADHRLADTAHVASRSAGDTKREITERAVVMEEIAGRMVKSGELIPDARQIRMIALHNPYAENPLDTGAFSGPHDEQWQGIQVNGAFGFSRSWQGPSIHEIGSQR